MRQFLKQFTWANVGLVLALTAGTPAIAEDIELFLSTPNSAGASKPNILFILDTSGSMLTIEQTQHPYDKDTVYPGSCQSDRYYWTTGTTIPECQSDERFSIPKSSFLCAQGIVQIDASGSFTNTMAQYRNTSTTGFRWRRIDRYSSAPVECANDSGVHGEGPGADVYAQIGTNTDMFTDNANSEVVWGSSPTDKTYSFYDPNYLNWYHNSSVTEMSRSDILKAVMQNVLGSISGVNVGFMELNFEHGGSVTRAVKDLDSSRSAAMDTIDNLPASGWTPLSETMYESALYWQDMNAYYGDSADTDSEALQSADPMVYEQPSSYTCAKNYTVLLTDGQPTRDTGAYSRVGNLPGWSSTLGYSNCTGGTGNGTCLDDISEYLSKHDINPEMPGEQTVTTHTIGFTVDLPILKEAAEKSGGEYYLADDVKTLTTVLTEIVTSIFDRDVSFTAPAVSVNAFNRTQHLNDLYISVFRASTNTHWPGNMKKYSVNGGVITDAQGQPAVDTQTGFFAENTTNFWSADGSADGPNVNIGGAASLLPDPATRNVFSNFSGSNLSSAANQISTGNAAAMDMSNYDLVGAVGEPSVFDLVEWIRGVDVMDIDNDSSTNARRQMGDTLHSQPASIIYGGDGTSTNADVVVYAATNDGYLHAIDGRTGDELWTFVPKELLPNMPALMEDESTNFKQYGIDGDLVPIVVDRNQNGIIESGTDYVYLIFGMRRGGNNYYALDVTNKNAPQFKWLRTYDGLGQSWSPPVPTRIDVAGAEQTSSDDLVLVLGGGFDTVHDQAAHPSSPDSDGAGIYIVDAETGNELWRAGADSGADLSLATMTRSIPSAIRVLDMTGNGYADRMYAADLGGQVWRFDVISGNSASALVTGGVIAQLGAEGAGGASPGNTRRFFSTPDVSLVNDDENDDRFIAINLGSGYRAHPLDKSANDRFYSIRDKNVFTKLSQSAYDAYSIIADDDLVEVSGRINVVLNDNDKGWKLTLPSNEKVLTESRTFDDTVYFVSFEPDAASADPCQAGLSINRLYRVGVGNGDPVVADMDALDETNEQEIDAARVTRLEQGGIAVRPVFLFPSPADPNCEGANCAPPPIGCVGVECFDPGFSNNPVRTLWTQDGIE